MDSEQNRCNTKLMQVTARGYRLARLLLKRGSVALREEMGSSMNDDTGKESAWDTF